MKLCRRNFLAVTVPSAFGVAVFDFGFGKYVDGAESPVVLTSPLAANLFGYAQAYEFRRDQEKNRKALETLAYIYSLSAQRPDSFDDYEKSIEKIKKAVAEGSTFAPEVFGDLSTFMSGGNNEWQKTNDEIAKYFGTSMQIGSAVAPLFVALSAPAAVALGVGAVIAEPALKATLNSTALLPPSPQIEVSALSSWAFTKAVELHEKQEKFKKLADDKTVVTLAGIDLSLPPSEVVEKLPSEIRKSFENLAKGARENTEAFQKRFRDASEKLVTELNRQFDAARKLKMEELTVWKRAQEVRKATDQLEQTNSDLAAVARIGSVVLQKVLNAPDAAKTFYTSVNAVREVYNASALFELGKIGTLTLTGSFVSAAVSLFSIGEPSADEQLMNAVRQIGQKIDAIKEQLDRIEANQVVIIRQLISLYSEMQKNDAAARGLLNDIRASLEKLSSDVLNGQQTAFLVSFQETVDQIGSLLRKPRTELYGDPAADKLREYLTKVYTYGVTTAKTSVWTGKADATLDFKTVSIELNTRSRAEFSFGLLPRLAALVGAKWSPTDVTRTQEGDFVANPIEWARAVETYLEAKIFASDVKTQDNEVFLREFWRTGQRIKAAAAIGGESRTLRDACSSLRSAWAKVRAELEKTSKDFESANSSQPYSIEHIQGLRGGVVYHQGKGGDFNERRDYDKNLLVSNDPLERAVSVGMIERQTFWEEHVGPRHSLGFKLIVKLGPRNGSELMSGRLFEHRVPGGTQRVWNPPGNNDYGQSPVPMFDACLKLLRIDYESDLFKKNFPAELQRRMQGLIDSSLIADFEGSGAIVRLFGCIARWRHQTTQLPFVSDVGNIQGIMSLAEFLSAVNSVLAKTENREGGWTPVLVESLDKMVASDIERIVGYGDYLDDEKGIPVVDGVLRKLGAYMLANKVPLVT